MSKISLLLSHENLRNDVPYLTPPEKKIIDTDNVDPLTIVKVQNPRAGRKTDHLKIRFDYVRDEHTIQYYVPCDETSIKSVEDFRVATGIGLNAAAPQKPESHMSPMAAANRKRLLRDGPQRNLPIRKLG